MPPCIHSTYGRIRQCPVTDIGGWPLVNESSRNEKKNRIAFEIWNAIPRVEKYKIGAVAQILGTIHFILFRDDPFTSGKSNVRRFIYERSATNIRDWTLAYSFIWLTTDRLIFTYLLLFLITCLFAAAGVTAGVAVFLQITMFSIAGEHLTHRYITLWQRIGCLIFQRLQKIRHIRNQKALLDSWTRRWGRVGTGPNYGVKKGGR